MVSGENDAARTIPKTIPFTPSYGIKRNNRYIACNGDGHLMLHVTVNGFTLGVAALD